jgi:uncharacterized protein (TIGR03083 family)
MTELDTLRHTTISEHRAALSLLRTLDVADWERPTRCSGWTVEHIARHLAGVADAFSGVVETIATGGSASLAPGHDAEGDRDAVLETYARAINRLDAALVRLTPEQFQASRFLLGIVRGEAALHHNDLVWALGEEAPLEASSAEPWSTGVGMLASFATKRGIAPPRPVSIRFAADSERVTLRFDGTAWTASHDDQAPVDTAMSGESQALALFVWGRVPATHRWLRVEGDPDVATEFKTWVPGP